MDEAAVVGGLLLVADEDGAALLQPGEGALDHPAAGWVALLAGRVELLLADAADVGDVAAGLGRGAAGWVVVGLVEAEALRSALGRLGTLDRDRVERRLQQLVVVVVGALVGEPDRDSGGL